jgi:hypothetical protein
VPPIFGVPDTGWYTDFRLVNLGLTNSSNNYTIACNGHSDLSDASNREWHICGVDPADLPPSWLVPVTLFAMDRTSRVLKINQSWVCDGPGGSM